MKASIPLTKEQVEALRQPGAMEFVEAYVNDAVHDFIRAEVDAVTHDLIYGDSATESRLSRRQRRKRLSLASPSDYKAHRAAIEAAAIEDRKGFALLPEDYTYAP